MPGIPAPKLAQRRHSTAAPSTTWIKNDLKTNFLGNRCAIDMYQMFPAPLKPISVSDIRLTSQLSNHSFLASLSWVVSCFCIFSLHRVEADVAGSDRVVLV